MRSSPEVGAEEVSHKDSGSALVDAPRSSRRRPAGGWSARRQVFAALLAVGVSAAAGAAVPLVLEPAVSQHRAQRQLDEAVAASGEVVLLNGAPQPYLGPVVPGSSPSQKHLPYDGGSGGAVFVFGNGKDSGSRRVVDLFLDFSDPRSRDLVLVNQLVLRSGVQSGKVLLQVHPVPSAHPYSLHAPQALALVCEESPEKAWDTMLALLAVSAELKPGNSLQVAAGASGLKEEGVSLGDYASWTVQAAEGLPGGTSVPALLVDGVPPGDELVLTDPQVFKKVVQ